MAKDNENHLQENMHLILLKEGENDKMQVIR